MKVHLNAPNYAIKHKQTKSDNIHDANTACIHRRVRFDLSQEQKIETASSREYCTCIRSPEFNVIPILITGFLFLKIFS